MNRRVRERELLCFWEWLEQLGFDDSVASLDEFRRKFYVEKGWVRE